MAVDYSRFQLGRDYSPLTQALQKGSDQFIQQMQFNQSLKQKQAEADALAQNKFKGGTVGAGGGYFYDKTTGLYNNVQTVQDENGQFKEQIIPMPYGFVPAGAQQVVLGGEVKKDVNEQQQQFTQENYRTKFGFDKDLAAYMASLNKESDEYAQIVQAKYAEAIARNKQTGKDSGVLESMEDLADASGNAKLIETIATQTYDSGIEAAKRIPVLNRINDLYNDTVVSGVPQSAMQAVARYVAGEDAAQSELSNLLDTEALSKLRETYGSQFTQVDREVLQGMMAGFSKNAEANKALLRNQSRKAQSDFNRAVRYAEKRGNEDMLDALYSQASIVYGKGDVGVDVTMPVAPKVIAPTSTTKPVRVWGQQ